MAIHIQEHIPLAPLTTFRIGGAARYFVEVSDKEQLQEAIAWAGERRVGFLLLAGGSNVLVPDAGVDGLVIHLVGDGFSCEDGVLRCDAGCTLLTMITAMSEQGFGGWEALAGIPGTVGGAVRGNAGAFGTEIREVVVEVVALHTETGEDRIFKNSECDFSYRHSFFKEHPEWIILEVVCVLEQVAISKSEQIINETIVEREKRHLQNVCAAGSFFMNPVAPKEVQEMFEKEKGVQSRGGRVPAGWLIEKAGMKGACIGDAQSSEQHANYIINIGNATATDVLALATQIKTAVKKQFGIDLQEEAYVVPHVLR